MRLPANAAAGSHSLTPAISRKARLARSLIHGTTSFNPHRESHHETLDDCADFARHWDRIGSFRGDLAAGPRLDAGCHGPGVLGPVRMVDSGVLVLLGAKAWKRCVERARHD